MTAGGLTDGRDVGIWLDLRRVARLNVCADARFRSPAAAKRTSFVRLTASATNPRGIACFTSATPPG